MRPLLLPLATLLATLTASAQLPSYVPTDGLVAWYPLSGNVSDLGPNLHDGTANSINYSSDRFGQSGQSAYLNGSNSFIGLNFPSVANTLNALTINAWVKTTDDHGPVCALRAANGGHTLEFNIGTQADIIQNPGHIGSLVRNSCCGAGNNFFGSQVNDNQWHMVTLVRQSNGVLRIYDNAVLTSQTGASNGGALQFATQYMALGSEQLWDNSPSSCGSCNSPHQRYLEGQLDDVGFWSRELSVAELSALYSAPAPSTSGCMDSAACNYDATATEDDGSCTYADYGRDCNGNCAGATRWFVDATADPAVATGDTLTPFATIQEALDMACPNDTVLIAPGTYVENVSSTEESVTIRGYAPSLPIDEVAANVIIDGNELGTALFISGQNTSVSDLSITNGLSSFGAGLYMSGAHGSIVRRCQIRDNHAAGDITGHGLALLSNDCLIENCSITENHGTKHTVDSRGSNNTIKHCRITDNVATAEGGGVVVYTHQMLIQDCVISDNEGGGLTTYRDDTVIDHCTISGNSNYGIYIWGYSDDAAIFITNSVISNPSIEFKMKQTGNIVTTAHLRNSIVEGGVDYDWLSVYKVFDVDGTLNTLDPVLLSDYTLASTSSAIGTAGGNRYDFTGTLGTPSSTLDLNYTERPQPVGTDADLGAFEHPLGTPEPTFGCTDDTACNYDPAATDDDASCIAPTCDDPTACNYDENATCGGGTCIPSGCMEEDACNYDPAAQCAGEACDYTCCPGPGCCDDPSQWDAALQQCNTAAPDTIVVTDTLLVPTPFCGAGTHWDPVTEMCIADVPGTVDENCTVMNLQELAEGYQVLLDHTADQDSIILAQQATIDALDAVCGCSAPVSYQGHDYEVVEIGGQCWFAENLQSASYRNGDAIPVLANSDWDDTPNGSQAAFDGDESNVIEYGRLYNWHAIDDPRRLCPSGWHVPDDAEWQVLIDGIGAQGGLQLKASSGWTAGPNGTDAHGFDGRPAGFRGASGSYANLGSLATWWSATPNENGGDAHVKSLIDNSDEVYQQQGISRQQGRSIRCLKN